MFQTDQATASNTLPAPASAGTPGYFTNGNPGSGVPATILDADFMNMLMIELSNVVTGAGITLSKTTYNQVLSAIKRIGQNTIVLADTGAANAYSATNSTPLVDGTWVDGVVQAVKIAHANTGASTYAPDGLTAIPIYGLGLQALQGGELFAGGVAALMKQTIPGVNSGNPICVLMGCAGGALQIAPAVQPQHAVQMTQVQSMLLGASGLPAISVATTLTNVYAGKHCVFGAGVPATLPAASSLNAGQSISFQSLFAGASVVRAGSDVITTGNGTPTSITLNAGDTLTLMSNGATGWYVVDGSTQLQYAAIMRSLTSLGTGTGYRQFPAYPGDPTPLLVQWGFTTSPTAANTESTTTLQTSFPNEFSNLLLTDYATLSNVGVIWTWSAKTLGNFKAYWGAGAGTPLSTNARQAAYIAIGR